MISFDESIQIACPRIKLGILQCEVQVGATDGQLLEKIEDTIQQIQSQTAIEQISQLPVIQASRKGYKACGKDPARYRLSAESLLRRVVQGKGLYQINNVVDTLNLVSISTGYSIGGYNATSIQGPISLGIGKEGEPYEGIGRGTLNIAQLPVLRDQAGAFGTPTSDSLRTAVNAETERFLMVFYDFDGQGPLQEALNTSIDWLTTYANGQHFTTSIISL